MRTVIIAVVLAIAVIGTAIFTIATSIKQVSSKDVAFEITSPTSATVTFDVVKDPAATVQCAVQVLNESYAVVGWKVATIGANGTDAGLDGGRSTTHTIALRTESLGVSGGVNACWVAD